MRRATIALLAATGMAFAITPTAGAQTEGFTLNATEYYPGYSVHVTASVTSGCQGSQVTSPGFAAPIDLHTEAGNFPSLYGDGKVIKTPGTYTAQATCRGEVVTRTFTIKPPYPPKFSFNLDKAEYDPGADIKVSAIYLAGECTLTVTSPGFAAPVALRKDPHHGPMFSGTGKVVTTPGSYTAQVECDGSEPITQSFKVKGSPATQPTPDPAPKPKPAPIVKPKGAPQTGGGGTASSQGRNSR
ncbi:hypothetical protein ABZX92_15895 [Lentzea sp. NPDC006480]|uniref:hypothetical protein n=1 Tax=Lentzea sp. NPDC006480 TaxID=3157176 RepID=UPI0033A2B5B2